MLFFRLYFKRVLLVLLVALSLTLSVLPQTQKVSYDYIDSSLDRALVSFALAKGLNALISVAQGTQLAATPAGVGVNFAIGELLDPVNDMVERFSWIMLASSVSLGIQKILSLILGSFGIQLLLLLLALSLLYGFFRNKKSMANFSLKFFLFIMILRFSMPLIALGNQALYTLFLSPSYVQSTQALQSTTLSLQSVQEDKQEQESGIWDKIKQVYKSSTEALNIKKHIHDLTQKLDESFKHMLTLMTLFIIETILSPLLFLYIFLKLLKSTGISERRSEWILEGFRSKTFQKRSGKLTSS